MNKKILLLGLIMLITIFVTGCFSIPSTIGLASVDEIDILILESFPVQINVIAKGNLKYMNMMGPLVSSFSKKPSFRYPMFTHHFIP